MPKGRKLKPRRNGTEEDIPLDFLHAMMLHHHMMGENFNLPMCDDSTDSSDSSDDLYVRTTENRTSINTRCSTATSTDTKHEHYFPNEKEFFKKYFGQGDQKSNKKTIKEENKPSLNNNEHLTGGKVNQTNGVDNNKNSSEVCSSGIREETNKNNDMPDMPENESNNKEKALKKKLKRLRQKQRKETEKNLMVAAVTEETSLNKKTEVEPNVDLATNDIGEDQCTASIVCDDLDKETIKEIEKTKNNIIEADKSIEDLEFKENIPAFISTALKGKQIKSLEQQSREATSTETPNNLDALYNENRECVNDGNHEQFTYVMNKRMLKQAMESVGEKAIMCILNDKILDAISYLSEAINNNPQDIRHYVNRSFCYLRQKQFRLAANDAQYILKNTDDNILITKALYFLAQSAKYMEDFEEAEKRLNECLNFMPRDVHIYRELMRIKIIRLLQLGFQEPDILSVLEKHSDISDATEILLQQTSNGNAKEDIYSNASATHLSLNDAVKALLQNPNTDLGNTQMLTSIIEKKLGLQTVSHNNNKIVNVRKNVQTSVPNKNDSNKKAVVKIQDQNIKIVRRITSYHRTIHVEKLVPKITYKMLHAYFARFGKIESLCVLKSTTHVFITYENLEAVSRVLAMANACIINNVKVNVSMAKKTY